MFLPYSWDPYFGVPILCSGSMGLRLPEPPNALVPALRTSLVLCVLVSVNWGPLRGCPGSRSSTIWSPH